LGRALLGLVAAALISATGCGASARSAGPIETGAPPAADGADSTTSPRADADDEGRATTPSETRAIDSLVTVAERIRGLRFVRPVRVRVEDSAAISASLSREMEDEDLLESRDLYVALGLLAPDVDVRSMLLRVLGEQVVGYYDTKHARLVVRDDVLAGIVRTRQRSRSALDEGGMVVVHELVHALQDQVLGLGAAYEAERTIDAGNAFHALVEGDATLAMIGYLAERGGGDLSRLTNRPDVLRAALDNSPPPAGSDELLNAPAIVRIPLLSAYFDGLIFCASLHARSAWPGVDRAYAHPPDSSEQVLHPDRFARGEAPELVTVPALPELAAAGMSTVNEDTIGELELGVYFRLALAEPDAERAADGWGGDRVRILRDTTGALGAVWWTTWDTEADAIEAESAAQRVMDTVPLAVRPTCAVVREGRRVLIVRGLRTELHAAVLRAFSFPTP
jgi:hypothetical protein